MQLKHLRTFLAVASTLSFTRAGQKVHLAQSSVTEQIQALEADLGVALFERSQRKLALTDAGGKLVEYAESLLALAADARAIVAGDTELRGSLTIGALETLCAHWLAPMLADFQGRHPGLQLDLQVAGTGALREAVRDGSLDLCFTFTQPPPDSGLHSECVGSDELALLVPAGHVLGELASVGPQHVAGERFLVTAQGCAYRGMFDSAFSTRGFPLPQVAGEYGSLGAIVSMVRARFGCALMPRLAFAGLDAGIVALPWEDGTGRVGIHMAWRPRQLPPALRRFQDAVRQKGLGLHHPVSTVDMQYAAGGEAVAHEEADRVGNVADAADAPNR
ncbi:MULTISPECIES: LysR family transcriptional regulator [unclassified Duganella]|uniref:LysR family transcriptional regulator n=1 Tax=unclassified Duganella TaxID=2636909 RepID=UPI00138F5AB3|nr:MULTISPECIES: LysR family transcriptional regulator [unclassified Duganella]